MIDLYSPASSKPQKDLLTSTLNWSDVQDQFYYHHPDKTKKNIYSYLESFNKTNIESGLTTPSNLCS